MCAGPTDAFNPEDCMSCAQDCGCGADRRCWSWDEELDPLHALSPDTAAYRVGSVCGADNPLFGAIPGRWRRTEFNGIPDNERSDFGVDIVATSCYIPDHEAGDACVYGFAPSPPAVLAGTRLFLRDPLSEEIEGEVLEGGRRMEYDLYLPEDPPEARNHLVWVKQD